MAIDNLLQLLMAQQPPPDREAPASNAAAAGPTQEQGLLAQLQSPFTPPEAVQPRKNIAQTAVAGLGDALSAYAAGMSPFVRKTFFSARLKELERQRAQTETQRATGVARENRRREDLGTAHKLSQAETRSAEVRSEERRQLMREEDRVRLEEKRSNLESDRQSLVREGLEGSLSRKYGTAFPGQSAPDTTSMTNLEIEHAIGVADRKLLQIERESGSGLPQVDPRKTAAMMNGALSAFVTGKDDRGNKIGLSLEEMVQGMDREQIMRDFETHFLRLSDGGEDLDGELSLQALRAKGRLEAMLNRLIPPDFQGPVQPPGDGPTTPAQAVFGPPADAAGAVLQGISNLPESVPFLKRPNPRSSPL